MLFASCSFQSEPCEGIEAGPRQPSLYRFVELYLTLQFDSIDKPVCFITNIMHFYYYSPVVELEIREEDNSRSSSIVQDCFSCPGFLFVCFHMKLNSVLSRSVKNCVEILIGIVLNLQITLGKMATFAMLFLPIHEDGRSFHLLIPFSKS